MTNTPEAIRKALEPMGYRWDEDLVRHPDYRSFFLSWDEALTHFLNDKSQTGARIADMVSMGYDVTTFDMSDYSEDGELEGKVKYSSTHWRRKTPRDWGHGDTPDESIAQLWLKVHGLEDPRSEA